MGKTLSAFLIIVVFAVGLSVGLYWSLGDNVDSQQTNIIKDSIQDVVIKEVQGNTNVIEVSTEVKKVSPYAKLVIEKFFKKCSHTTLEVMDIPKELVNLTEDEFKEKYKNWTVKSFENNEISIYREIDANCDDHYVIKEKDGYVAIYKEITDELVEFSQITDIAVDNLRDEDKKHIETGVKLYGVSEVSSFIEDFES